MGKKNDITSFLLTFYWLNKVQPHELPCKELTKCNLVVYSEKRGNGFGKRLANSATLQLHVHAYSHRNVTMSICVC